MRTRLDPLRTLLAAVTLVATVGLAGCGGSSDQTADPGGLPETPQARVASVDVTYYYLPG